MDPRDDTIGYGTEESTNSGTDPDMPPLVDGKAIVRSWSNGEVEVRSSVATRESQVQFRCQLRRRAKSAGCFFHHSEKLVSGVRSVGCQPTLRTIPAGEAMMRVDV